MESDLSRVLGKPAEEEPGCGGSAASSLASQTHSAEPQLGEAQPCGGARDLEISQLILSHKQDCESCSQEQHSRYAAPMCPPSSSCEPPHQMGISGSTPFHHQLERKQRPEVAFQDTITADDFHRIEQAFIYHQPRRTMAIGQVWSEKQSQTNPQVQNCDTFHESPKWCFFGPPSAWEKCDTPHDGPCTPYCRRSVRDGEASLVRVREIDCNRPEPVPEVNWQPQHCAATQNLCKVGACLHDSSGDFLIGDQSEWFIRGHTIELDNHHMKSIGYKDTVHVEREDCKGMFDSQWPDLMDEVLGKIFKLLSLEDAKRCRLVCQPWRNTVDFGTEELKLSWLKSRHFVLRFPFLRKLDLTRCVSIRNKDLAVVRETTAKLQHLHLGSALTPPLITNKGLEQLKPMLSLSALSLNECRAITNNGLAALTCLKGLQKLSLRGCVAVTNKGVQQIGNIHSLTSLNLFGCVRVGDGGMEHLSSLTTLHHLFLGRTRVRDEGLHHIGKCTTLRELFIFSEDVNDAGIIELAPLVNLERLTLRETFSLEGNGVEELVQKVTGLKHLDLCNSEMDDEQFINATYDWRKLESLDLRGCFISDSALNEVTQLTTLKSLSIEPFWELPIPPQTNFMFSSFSSLTHLGLVGDSVTVEMIAAVGMLPKLVELSIGDHVFSENLLSRQPLNDGVVNGLTALTRLTSLDVSRQWLTKDQIILLADKLHNLRELCVFDCKATDEELVSIQQRFPHINFHEHIMKDGVLDVEHAPGDVWAGQPGFF